VSDRVKGELRSGEARTRFIVKYHSKRKGECHGLQKIQLGRWYVESDYQEHY